MAVGNHTERALHPLRRASAIVSAGAATILIALVRAYQVALAPLLIGSCKFAPTCSEYFIEAVRTHGPLRGGAMGVWRVCRCNPFGKGGIDPVPPREADDSPAG